MKKILVLLLVFISSCSQNSPSNQINNEHEKDMYFLEPEITKYYLEDVWENREYFYTLELDSCEYLLYSERTNYAGFGFMAHKGNCKYCKERGGCDE